MRKVRRVRINKRQEDQLFVEGVCVAVGSAAHAVGTAKICDATLLRLADLLAQAGRPLSERTIRTVPLLVWSDECAAQNYMAKLPLEIAAYQKHQGILRARREALVAKKARKAVARTKLVTSNPSELSLSPTASPRHRRYLTWLVQRCRALARRIFVKGNLHAP